jgi:hypothetical protein
VKAGSDIDGLLISVKSKSARFCQEAFPPKEALSKKKKAFVPSDSLAGSIEERKSPAIHRGRQGFINLILFFYKDYSFHDPCGPWKRLQRYEEKSEKPSNFEYLIFSPLPSRPCSQRFHRWSTTMKRRSLPPPQSEEQKASFYS